MRLLPSLSKWTFRSLRFAEYLFGLPKNVSQSLQFRYEWESYCTEDSSQPTLWIHGASLGELEDLANFFLSSDELAQAGYSFERLIVTSSSVSSLEFLRKTKEKYPILYAGPIPPEEPYQIQKFCRRLKPELLVLSHSDLWPQLCAGIQKHALSKGIIWLPSRKDAAKRVFENLVHKDKLVAVGARQIDDLNHLKDRLKNYSDTQFEWIGNPRVDRIFSRISEQKAKDNLVLESYRATPDPKKLSIIIGSAWPEDAAVFAQALRLLSPEEIKKIQIVVLPHITNDMHITASIQHLLPMAKVLPVHGILLEAYQKFDLAYVGGGFRTGLHSILEPLLWACPTICGPLLKKQPEAVYLESIGAIFSAVSEDELSTFLRNSLDKSFLLQKKEDAQQAKDVLTKSLGASKRLSQLIHKVTLKPHD